jgi:hypothetical protein
VYGRLTLPLYDFVVYRIASPFAWGISPRRLLAHYDGHVGASHLDVGVGTGYFLDRCRFPAPRPRIGLLDVNEHCLRHAARRIARYEPSIFTGDLRGAIALDTPLFESIGLNYVLHCLPGPFAAKAHAFDALLPHLAPGGTLFGSTILGAIEHNALGSLLMRRFNRTGTFDNRTDGAADLEAALRARFEHCDLEITGRVALFAARKSCSA